MFQMAAIFFILSSICTIPSIAYPFYRSDTGQTKCYDTAGTEITCTGTGQDGMYSINPLNFIDNGNGTVTDNNTGLMWQQEFDSTTYNWYQASGTYDATHNPSSQNVCGTLIYAGHNDWRLPSKKELVSIVDYSVPSPGPTIRQTYFPNMTASATLDYWSSTTEFFYQSPAWHVNFNRGDAAYYDKSMSSWGHVRCVRGSQETPHLQDNGNGTVTDTGTNLIWQQDEPSIMSFGNALSYCENLSLAGRSDWRLPNVRELESLTDDNQSRPTIDTSFFPNANTSYYWTSTTYANFLDYSWYVTFSTGIVSYATKAGYNYVRCVCGGHRGVELALGFSGTGSGSVTSNGVRHGAPTGFSTNVVSTGQFDAGTNVSLHAEPSEYSLFTSWSGACGVSPDCNLAMLENMAITATFEADTAHKTQIVNNLSHSPTLQEAYNSPAAGEVKAWAIVFEENLICNLPKQVTLRGGFNQGYTFNDRYTTLDGYLQVVRGELTVEQVVIR